MREIIGNLLMHREYSNAFPAKLIIESKRLLTENSNNPNASGRIDPQSFSPFSKNPSIARVFREIGRADELGSGVRKLYRYCKDFCGHDPELVEDDIFRFSLSFVGSVHETQRGNFSVRGGGETSGGGSEKTPTGGSEETADGGSEETGEEAAKGLKNNHLEQSKESEETTDRGSEKTPTGGSEETADGGSEETGEEAAKGLKNNHLEQSKESEETTDRGSEETLEKILILMRKNTSISATEIAQSIGISSRVVERHIAKLKAAGRIKRVGPTKSGVWQVLG